MTFQGAENNWGGGGRASLSRSINYFLKISRRNVYIFHETRYRVFPARKYSSLPSEGNEYFEYKSFVRMNEACEQCRDFPDSSSSGRNRKFRVTREKNARARYFRRNPPRETPVPSFSTGCPRNPIGCLFFHYSSSTQKARHLFVSSQFCPNIYSRLISPLELGLRKICPLSKKKKKSSDFIRLYFFIINKNVLNRKKIRSIARSLRRKGRENSDEFFLFGTPDGEELSMHISSSSRSRFSPPFPLAERGGG